MSRRRPIPILNLALALALFVAGIAGARLAASHAGGAALLGMQALCLPSGERTGAGQSDDASQTGAATHCLSCAAISAGMPGQPPALSIRYAAGAAFDIANPHDQPAGRPIFLQPRGPPSAV